MDRIIPFGYPTIPGGASGGASVDPTPPSSDDPETPTTLPYNLDAFHMIPTVLAGLCEKVGNVWIATGSTSSDVFLPYLKTEGIVPVDLTSVKQIKITGPTTWIDDSVVLTADGVDIRDRITNPQYGIGTQPRILTIAEFLDNKTFFWENRPSFTVSNYNSYVKGKQIVVSYPLTVEILDTQGEVMQSASVAVSL